MADPTPVTISTDGACLGNPGIGGWGAILRYGEHEKRLSGAESETTNNRMELTAPIEALTSLNRRSSVVLRTDSTYVRNGITQWVHGWQRNGWMTKAKEPVKNEDLWRALIDACAAHDVEWQWVKGHAGDPDNEIADELATTAARELRDTSSLGA